MPKPDESLVNQVHNDAIIIDGRDPTHLMYAFTREDKPDWTGSIREGGISAILVDACWLYDRFADMARSFSTWYERVDQHPDRLTIALCGTDIEKAHQENKTSFVLTAQNSDWVEEDVSLVPMARKMGLRCSQIVYQSKNPAGDGCGEKADSGLSKFGVKFVKALNENNIVIDLSHAGPQTALDTVRESEQPVVFSHSNARALCDHMRNVSDELMKELAAKGGVIGASAYNQTICPGGGDVGATLDQFVDQIEYMAGKIGIDHVAFGLDAGEGRTELEVKILHSKAKGLPKAPKVRYQQDLTPRRKMKNLTRALLARGFSPEDTAKILGGNFLRVFKEVWGA